MTMKNLLISKLVKRIKLRIPLTVVCILLVAIGAFASPDQLPKRKQRIVFLISEDTLNYEAHKTIPVFARMLGSKTNYDITVILGKGSNNAFSFPGLEILRKTDLVVLFSRRIALPTQQMALFKRYLQNGGALVSVRTGNHAFTTRGQISAGYEDWPGFVAEILGCGNYGYGPVDPGTDVTIAPGQRTHPILKDFKTDVFHSTGNLYMVTPLTDAHATVLLNGTDGKETQPVAWTRMAGKSKVFYTTLGYPTDFSTDLFNNLLVNAIHWALN
jgi:type 1 glutamine amidotransferase